MMKQKLLALLVAFLFVFGLSACTPKVEENPPLECETGFHVVDDECVEDQKEPVDIEDPVDLSMYDPINGRYITFFDDFDGDELDETVWEHMIGTGVAYGIPYWGNNEAQYYKAENTTVSNGELRIQVKKEQTPSDDGSYTMLQYSSSRLRTKGSFYQTYGRFEARIRIDTAEQGLWPAFWLLPEENVYGGWPNSGEFDIMEIRGRLPLVSTAALHLLYGRHTYYAGEVSFPNGSDITDYHVYAVEWTPTRITYFMDDEIVLDLLDWPSSVGDFPAPFDQDFHILLNMAVGGQFDGNRLPSDSALPATMIVDYVKVYAYEDEFGRKIPEGNGQVFLTYDELTISLFDAYIDLEYFVFQGKQSDVGWFTSNSKIAVVNQEGRVTPIAPGIVTITVATATSEATCTITIVEEGS